MTTAASPRWGIIGTANIARAAFLPALRAAGGIPAAVAGRDLARAEEYAREHGIARAVAGYQNDRGPGNRRALPRAAELTAR